MLADAIQCEALPEFQDNYLWVVRNALHQAIIVDPGDAKLVLEKIREGLKPVAFFVTHHHPDHISGLAELAKYCNAPIYAPVDERIPIATQRVSHDQQIFVPELDLHFRVIAVPGHTRSHVAYYGAGHLFCGDTLFSLGCGRLFEGSPEQMLHSLDVISSLPSETRICCSHEYTLANARFAEAAEPDNPERDSLILRVREKRAQNQSSLPSRLDIELACNPFLRSDLARLWPLWSRESGHMIQNRLQAFTALRAWKDNFRL